MEIDYMKHDDRHMKGYGRGSDTSRNIKVMVKIHKVSVDMNKTVTRNFMPV